MKKLLFIMIAAGLLFGCGKKKTENPFFTDWDTPFGVPPFEQIKNEHYMPAFEEGMKQQKAEIKAITDCKDAPDFENTILALDKSGTLLEKVALVFYGLYSANTSDTLQELANRISPLTTQHSDDIAMNPELFRRIKAVYEMREDMALDAVRKRLVEETYRDFVRSGANLDTVQQKRLRELNKEIDMLQLQFGQNLLADINSYRLIIGQKEELAGLPDVVVATAAEAANADSTTRGKWIFTLRNPSVIPFLQYSDNRALREKIFTAYINRGNNNNKNDNKAVIEKLIPLRLEKAKLLGYPTYADYALEDRMAKKPENVYKLLDQVWVPALAMAKKEDVSMNDYIRKNGEKFAVEGWDWRYYSEKVMKEQFDLDEEILRPYFKLENVRDGIFWLANKLYGITFTEVPDAPKYDKEVKLYECRDTDGTHLGVLYLDFFPREGKRGGAWCGGYRSQVYRDGKRIAPVMTVVCNFSMPTADKPSLLSPDETETFFHEFGHALNGLFADVPYVGLSDVPRDFVELPSQIMEHWVFEPEVLKQYAKHYQSGEVIPAEIVEKINKSRKYGQGFKTTEYVAASILDMDYHTLKEIPSLDVLKFETGSMNRIGLIPQIPPRYRSTYFQHTMTGGYTAGYYSYLWAEVLDADAYEAFKETGDIFNKEIATRFRKNILEKGNMKDAMQEYVDFRGKEPGIGPLLENRGLK
jgi:peptidyl-dipeptidase Dcp